MKRRALLTGAAVATLGVAGIGDIVKDAPLTLRVEKGFASIYDVASFPGETKGVGISFPTPFGSYGPKSVSFLIYSEFNVSNIVLTPPNPYGCRFTVTAREGGQFECSIIWTAEG